MRYYEPGIRPDDDQIDFNKSMINRPILEQISDTAVRITLETMNMDEEPSYYIVSYKNISSGVTTIVSPNPTTSPLK